MQVILLDKIARLGGLGDTVEVKSGFARNYLIPQGKAVMATKANIEMFETRRAELEAKLAGVLAAAEARAAQIAALENVTIESKSGDEGKLFGSIGTRDVADAITAAGVAVAKVAWNVTTASSSAPERARSKTTLPPKQKPIAPSLAAFTSDCCAKVVKAADARVTIVSA